MDEPPREPPHAHARIDDASVTYVDPASGWMARKGERAPPFPPGNKVGSHGRPPGASPRTALLRALAANPDADGIGAKSVELAESILAKALELGRAVADADDPDSARALQSRAKALDSLLATLAEIEPNVRKSESTQTVQRVVFSGAPPRVVEAEQAGGGAMGVERVGAGPIHDAPLPSLGATQQDPSPAAPGPIGTDPHPAPVQNLDTPGPT